MAYQHPDGPTWFAGTRRKPGRALGKSFMKGYLLTSQTGVRDGFTTSSLVSGCGRFRRRMMERCTRSTSTDFSACSGSNSTLVPSPSSPAHQPGAYQLLSSDRYYTSYQPVQTPSDSLSPKSREAPWEIFNQARWRVQEGYDRVRTILLRLDNGAQTIDDKIRGIAVHY